MRHEEALPGHGALRWEHIHYGVDGRFYLSHWERCARRHPGIDVASFVADLLRHTWELDDDALFDVGLETFARSYVGDAPAGAWWSHLPALVAGEIALRCANSRLDPSTALELITRAVSMRLS